MEANNLRNTRLYHSIMHSKEQLLKRGVDDNSEAEETAWEDRRNALKVFIENNQDEIKKWIFPEEEDEEEEDKKEENKGKDNPFWPRHNR